MSRKENSTPQVYPEPSGIKSWAEDDRPREKLMLKGKHSLSESELIAILLRTGSRESTAVDVAKKILSRANNDLNALSRFTVKDLLSMKIMGLGETKAITIVAALELGRRRQSSEAKEKDRIITSRDAFDILQPQITDYRHEEFWIMLLNRANRVISFEKVSEGGITGTIADPRKIFNIAIKGEATGVILCHNHPSGNLSPSSSDIELTKKMKEAGKVLDIPVLDHLIISENKYYSFADEGML